MLSHLVSSVEERVRQTMIRTLGYDEAFLLEHRARTVLSLATWRFRDLDRPIFLWGAGRTGSYLLYDLLSLHPDVVCTRGKAREAKGLYGTAHHGPSDHGDMLRNPFPPLEGGPRHLFRQRPGIGPATSFGRFRYQRPS